MPGNPRAGTGCVAAVETSTKLLWQALQLPLPLELVQGPAPLVPLPQGPAPLVPLRGPLWGLSPLVPHLGLLQLVAPRVLLQGPSQLVPPLPGHAVSSAAERPAELLRGPP